MKNLFRILMATLMIFGSSALALTEADRAQVRGGAYQLLLNPGYENGRGDWTSGGGSPAFALVNAGSNLLFGKGSVTFDPTASGEWIQTSLYTVPEGLKGKACLARVWYKGGDATNVLKVLDNGGNLVASRTFTGDTGRAEPLGINFSCPSSGSIRLRVESTANASLVALDNAHLGEADNVTQNSQAESVARAYRATSGQAVASTSETKVQFNAESWDLYNEFDSTTNFRYTATRPGKYQVCYSAYITSYTIDEALVLRIKKNGSTNIAIKEGTAGVASNSQSVCGVADLVAGDYLEGYVDSVADASYTVFEGDSTTFLEISRLPAASETSFRAETQNWKIDANISGANIALGSSVVNAYQTPDNGSLTLTNNAGSGNIAAMIGCAGTTVASGTTCSAANEQPSISFTLPAAQDVLACVSFGWSNVTGGTVDNGTYAAFQIVETANNSQTIIQEGKSRIAAACETPANNALECNLPLRVCGNFSFSSAGQKTLRLAYEQNHNGTPAFNQIYGDANSGQGQRDIHWEVYPITQQVPAPVLIGSVTSNTSGQERIERAQFTCSGSSSVSSQSGTWASIANISSGSCAVTLTGGTFSTTPVCVIADRAANSAADLRITVDPQSSTSVNVGCYNNGTASNCTSFTAAMLCMGPR